VPRFPRSPLLAVIALAGGSLACSDGGAIANPGEVAFLPSRAAIQDLSVAPATGVAGDTVTIRFRLTRTGDTRPLFWTSHFVETPSAGGTLSVAQGGPFAPGAEVEILYRTRGATVAFLTLYPASTPGAPTGDGSGDWESFAIPVNAAP
jgi:hypothetical protein